MARNFGDPALELATNLGEIVTDSGDNIFFVGGVGIGDGILGLGIRRRSEEGGDAPYLAGKRFGDLVEILFDPSRGGTGSGCGIGLNGF